MAIFRVERTRDYTVMCNCHLRDQNLSLKAKGLLSMMLSLPDDWNFTTKGLATICKEGVEAIGTGLKELEKAGYIVRHLLRGEHGRITDISSTSGPRWWRFQSRKRWNRPRRIRRNRVRLHRIRETRIRCPRIRTRRGRKTARN